MAQNNIIEIHRKVLDNVFRGNLGKAFSMLGTALDKSGNDNLKTQFIGIRSNYRLVLDYMLKGTQDDERPQLYQRTGRQLLELADRLLQHEKAHNLSDPLTALRNNWLSDPFNKAGNLGESYRSLIADHQLDKNLSREESETEVSGAVRRDQLLEQVFNHCWLNPELEDDSLRMLKELFNEGTLPADEQALLLSGINLGLLLNFSSTRIMLLLDVVGHEDPAIRVRAITGLIQAIQRYDKRFSFYPEINAALETMLSELLRKEELEILLLQIIRSQDTEAITRKLRDEIIPEMIKAGPRVTEKLDEQEFSIEDFGSEENPNWEEFFEDSPELFDKIQEFNEMQQDGSDVFMSAFANLKHFPFFRKLHHWFLPFSKDNKLVINELHKVKEDMDTMKFVKGLEASSFLCNSDKYSFLFNIGSLSSQQLGMLDKYFAAEMDMMNELQNEDQLLDEFTRFRAEARMYIQDLYRFHKLHPLRRSIPDMFKSNLRLHKTAILGPFLEQSGLLRKIAEFHFARGHYEQSAGIFAHLAEKGETSYEVFEKAGFSYQKIGHFDKALDQYKKAELFDTNQEWLLKKIAYCYRQLNKPKEAIGFYREALKKAPDNERLLMQLANTLLEARKFNDALQQYYTIELKYPDNTRVIRPLAWCLLNTGKAGKAIEYMERLPGEKLSWHDHLNLGHMHWAKGDLSMASSNYLQAGKHSPGLDELIASFDRDSLMLEKQGVPKEEIAMLKDALQMDWQKE